MAKKRVRAKAVKPEVKPIPGTVIENKDVPPIWYTPDSIVEEKQPVGRPRKGATVSDLICKLREAQVIGREVSKQNPMWRRRILGVIRIIDRWCNVVLKKIDHADIED